MSSYFRNQLLRMVLDVDMSEELQESNILNDPSDTKGAGQGVQDEAHCGKKQLPARKQT